MVYNFVLLATAWGLWLWCRPWGVFTPVRMFLLGWLIVFVTSTSGLVLYDSQLTLPTVALILASLFAFVIGARAVPRSQRQPRRGPQQLLDDFDRLAIAVLCLFTGFATIFVFSDLAGGGLHRLTNFSTEASGIRKEMWSAFSAGEVEISPARSIAITSALIVATLFPWASKHRVRILKYASGVAIIVVALSSFLVAGRALTVVLAICLLVCWGLTSGTDSLRRIFTLPRVLSIAAAGYYLLIVFPTQRNSSLTGTYIDRNLWYRGRAYFPDWVNSVGSLPGMEWVKIFSSSSQYFSGPLHTLNYFITETDVFSWYKLGLYNVTQISQVAGAFGKDDITPWQQIRFDLATLLSYGQQSGNPWSTGLRDLGIDFGLLAVPVIGILGYVAQSVYERSTAADSYIGLVAATYVSVSSFIFAFISPFQIRVIGNGFWLIGFIALARYLIGRHTPKEYRYKAERDRPRPSKLTP